MEYSSWTSWLRLEKEDVLFILNLRGSKKDLVDCLTTILYTFIFYDLFY